MELPERESIHRKLTVGEFIKILEKYGRDTPLYMGPTDELAERVFLEYFPKEGAEEGMDAFLCLKSEAPEDYYWVPDKLTDAEKLEWISTITFIDGK